MVLIFNEVDTVKVDWMIRTIGNRSMKEVRTDSTGDERQGGGRGTPRAATLQGRTRKIVTKRADVRRCYIYFLLDLGRNRKTATSHLKVPRTTCLE